MRSLRGTLVVAWRDYRSAFDGPLAYVLFAAFLVVAGAVFASLLLSFSDLSSSAQALAADDASILGRLSIDVAVVSPLLSYLCLVLFVMAPLLTMRLFAEEARAGTMELLLTAPISPTALVLGKFLGGLALTLTPLLLTTWYPIVLVAVATPDAMTMATGYLGIVLVAAAFTSVGLLASSLTDSPLLAAFLGFCGLVVLALCGVVGDSLEQNAGKVLAALSPLRHAHPLLQGVIDTGDVAFLLLFTSAALFVTQRVIESRSWR